jgi:hypothetical protein
LQALASARSTNAWATVSKGAATLSSMLCMPEAQKFL